MAHSLFVQAANRCTSCSSSVVLLWVCLLSPVFNTHPFEQNSGACTIKMHSPLATLGIRCRKNQLGLKALRCFKSNLNGRILCEKL